MKSWVRLLPGVMLPVITHAAATHAQVPTWRLSDRPIASIGAADGDERYTLSNVSGVLLLRDGRTAIAERSNARIRVYDRAGRHIADRGRKGQGPGEYQYIRTILFRVSADGARVDSIGSWRSMRYSYDASAPNRIRDYHFSPHLSYSMTRDRLYLGNGETYTIEVLTRGTDGTLRPSTIRGAAPLLPVTRDTRREFEEELRRSYAANPQMYEGPVESYLRGEFPETLPAYTSFYPDELGNLGISER